MANKYMKKCPISMAIKEMQIKKALRFHLLWLEWLSSIIQTTIAGKGGKEKPYPLLVGK
jgi:hypothetical protein